MSRWLSIARAAKEGQIPEYTPVPIVPIVPKGHERGAIGTNGTNGTEVQTTKPIDIDGLTGGLREQFEERAAIAEFDGGLSRTEAELLAWDELLTCAQCHRDTGGEADAVRVSGGGWLHLDKCYDGYFRFRQE